MTTTNRPTIIYRYEFPNGKSYIGSTIRGEARHKQHIYDQRAYIAGERKGCPAFYEAVEVYGGFDNLKYEILLECQESTRVFFENKMIHAYNSKVPNGYNLADAEGPTPLDEATKAKQKANIKIGIHQHIESYRIHNDELENLPAHVVWFQKGDVRGYRIHNHPLCPSKRFADKKTPLEELKAKVETFLETLTPDKPYKSAHRKREELKIPRGVILNKNGTVRVEKVVKKKLHKETLPNIEYAKCYIDRLKMIHNCKQCCSETGWQSTYSEDVRNYVLDLFKVQPTPTGNGDSE